MERYSNVHSMELLLIMMIMVITARHSTPGNPSGWILNRPNTGVKSIINASKSRHPVVFLVPDKDTTHSDPLGAFINVTFPFVKMCSATFSHLILKTILWDEQVKESEDRRGYVIWRPSRWGLEAEPTVLPWPQTGHVAPFLPHHAPVQTLRGGPGGPPSISLQLLPQLLIHSLCWSI